MPLQLVNAKSCPAILAYACMDTKPRRNSSDGIIPVADFNDLVDRLSKAGVPHEARLFTQTGHGDIAAHFEEGRSGAWIVEMLATIKERGTFPATAGAPGPSTCGTQDQQ